MQYEPMSFSVFGVTVYAYGLGVAISALLCLGLLYLLMKKRGLAKNTLGAGITIAACGLVGSRVLYAIYYLIVTPSFFSEGDWTVLLRLPDGGLMLYGGLMLGALGLAVYAKVTKVSLAALTDCVAPVGALFIALARASEFFTVSSGIRYVESEELMAFPYALENEFGSWIHPIFLLEALAALLIFILLLVRFERKKRTGSLLIILYAAMQLMLESLCQGDAPKFGFVKVNMILSALVLGGFAISFLVHHRRGAKALLPSVLVILGLVTAIEFALDKSTLDNRLLYIVMSVLCVVLCVLIARVCDRPNAKRV